MGSTLLDPDVLIGVLGVEIAAVLFECPDMRYRTGGSVGVRVVEPALKRYKEVSHHRNGVLSMRLTSHRIKLSWPPL